MTAEGDTLHGRIDDVMSIATTAKVKVDALEGTVAKHEAADALVENRVTKLEAMGNKIIGVMMVASLIIPLLTAVVTAVVVKYTPGGHP